MPQPVAYIAAAAAADAEPPSQTAASGAAPDAAAVQLEVDERFASLRRSYADRLVSMAAVFKELPRRLTEDGPLESLRMCDADPDDLRERAMEIFGEALVSSQEQQIQALQQQLAAKESETARLGRQLGTLITEQREGRDKPSRMLQVAEAELHVLRPRLAELEEYHRRAELRSKALEARATTLEEETLHWRARCAPATASSRSRRKRASSSPSGGATGRSSPRRRRRPRRRASRRAGGARGGGRRERGRRRRRARAGAKGDGADSEAVAAAGPLGRPVARLRRLPADERGGAAGHVRRVQRRGADHARGRGRLHRPRPRAARGARSRTRRRRSRRRTRRSSSATRRWPRRTRAR